MNRSDTIIYVKYYHPKKKRKDNGKSQKCWFFSQSLEERFNINICLRLIRRNSKISSTKTYFGNDRSAAG